MVDVFRLHPFGIGICRPHMFSLGHFEHRLGIECPVAFSGRIHDPRSTYRCHDVQSLFHDRTWPSTDLQFRSEDGALRKLNLGLSERSSWLTRVLDENPPKDDFLVSGSSQHLGCVRPDRYHELDPRQYPRLLHDYSVFKVQLPQRKSILLVLDRLGCHWSSAHVRIWLHLCAIQLVLVDRRLSSPHPLGRNPKIAHWLRPPSQRADHAWRYGMASAGHASQLLILGPLRIAVQLRHQEQVQGLVAQLQFRHGRWLGCWADHQHHCHLLCHHTAGCDNSAVVG